MVLFALKIFGLKKCFYINIKSKSLCNYYCFLYVLILFYDVIKGNKL